MKLGFMNIILKQSVNHHNGSQQTLHDQKVQGKWYQMWKPY